MRRAGLALVVLLCLTTGVLAQEANPIILGQIAYIGVDFNVYTLSGDSRTMLTDDAGIQTERLRYYQFPTWSTDGRLAYFGTEVTVEREVSMEVFVSADGTADGESVYVGEDQTFTYAYWSPSSCGGDCYDLAVLLSSAAANGFLVNVIRDSADEPNVTQIGTGSPFYYSWSPDGQRMVWHRNNRQIDIYDASAGEISSTLDETPGAFFAPAWSPVDDRVLFGVANGRNTDLTVAANGEVTTLVENLPSPIHFVWSPDGNQIAYKDANNPLIVIDAITGEIVAQTNVSDVYAFFWSPDSRFIAYITPAELPGSFSAKPFNQNSEPPELSWSVLEVATSDSHRYGGFAPTSDQLYLLTYFDQFAQSHRVWSPDSRHLIYSEIDADNTPQIMLLDTQSNVVPLSVAEGFFGVWSFE